jgi:hypothetical protein
MRTNQRLAQLWLDALATELGAAVSTIETFTDKSPGPGALPQALQVVAHAKEVCIQSFRSTVQKPLAMPVTSAHVLKAWVHDVRCSAALMLEGRQKRFAT